MACAAQWARGCGESLAGVDFKQFTVNSVIGEGPLVIALAHGEFLFRATGKQVHDPEEGHVYHCDSQGRVVRFRHIVDTLQHSHAMQP